MRTRARATEGPAEGSISGGGGGGGGGRGGGGLSAFVTVGTTKFDALVAAVDDPRVAAALVARGFRRLVMQARPSSPSDTCISCKILASESLPCPACHCQNPMVSELTQSGISMWLALHAGARV